MKTRQWVAFWFGYLTTILIVCYVGCILDVSIGYWGKLNSKPITIEKVVVKDVLIPYAVEKIVIKKVEVPVIVERLVIKEVKVPVITEKVIIKEVKIPVVVEKIVIKEIPVIVERRFRF